TPYCSAQPVPVLICLVVTWSAVRYFAGSSGRWSVTKMPGLSTAVLKQSPDLRLIGLWLALLSIGLVMVASSSIAFAAANPAYLDGWYFVKRHLVFLLMSAAAATVILVTPVQTWQRLAPVLLTLALLLL